MSQKMTKETNELLSRYLEGDLDENQQEEVQHLLEDEAYREDLDFLKRTLSCLGQMSTVEAPPDFAKKVRHRVRRVRIKRRMKENQQNKFFQSYGLLVGIVVAIAVVLYLMFQLALVPTPPKGPSSQAPSIQRTKTSKSPTKLGTQASKPKSARPPTPTNKPATKRNPTSSPTAP